MPKRKPEPSILDLAHALLDPAQAVKPACKGVFGTGNFRKKVKSHGLAVHPNQIKEVAAQDKKLGVPVEYDPKTGKPQFDNSAHFRRYCKAYGLRHMGY